MLSLAEQYAMLLSSVLSDSKHPFRAIATAPARARARISAEETSPVLVACRRRSLSSALGCAPILPVVLATYLSLVTFRRAHLQRTVRVAQDSQELRARHSSHGAKPHPS